MTVTPRSLDDDSVGRAERTDAPAPVLSAAHVPALAGGARDRTVFPLLLVGLTAFYVLLQNPYWVPSGDSEVYISIARDIVRGRGYQFNGQPVAMVPPGWPALMALVMWVAPYFLPLKLLAMTCMIGALAISYWIARRFVTPTRAALVVALAAVLSYVYQSTIWLISEAPFCLACAGALLLAFQVREGRRETWRIACLALLCAVAILVRWAGVLNCLLVVAVLVDGQLWPRSDRRWYAAVLCILVTFGTFFGLREALEVSPDEARLAREFGGAGEFVAEGEPLPTTMPLNPDDQVAQTYSLIAGSSHGLGYGDRFIGWGRWLAWLYWQPFRAAAGSWVVETIAGVAGWILIVLLLVLAIRHAVHLRWFWLAVLLYCGVLAINWPVPNARYLVPIAVPITLGILLSSQELIGWARNRVGRALLRTGVVVFVVSIFACNLALWTVEVSVAHADDFYGAYEAGLNRPLIAAARHIAQADPSAGGIAVTPLYKNLNRTRQSPFGLRATVLLTGRNVSQLPRKWQGTEPGRRLAGHLHLHGVRWYIHQTPVSPWRIWHFRAAWWQRKRTGEAPEIPDSGWQLYRVVDHDTMVRVDLPESRDWPTRVPGLN